MHQIQKKFILIGGILPPTSNGTRIPFDGKGLNVWFSNAISISLHTVISRMVPSWPDRASQQSKLVCMWHTARWLWGISQCHLSAPGPELCSCRAGCTCCISETLNITFKLTDVQHMVFFSKLYKKHSNWFKEFPVDQACLIHTF